MIYINKLIYMQKIETKMVSLAVRQTLSKIITHAFPQIKSDVLLQNGPKGECDYVSPSAMKQFNVHKNRKQNHTYGTKTVAEFAQKITQSFEVNHILGSLTSNEKGFLQLKLNDSFIESSINHLIQDLSYPLIQKQKIVVDFSSPNIAKEMHVGHLRSTIIGESVCRILQFMGHEVLRNNHVGDWGTQFGMLINYMKQTFPNYETIMPDVKDLDGYYKAARHRFDTDAEFKKVSQETVVKLQAYDENCIKAWKMICAVSREYFQVIYKRLGITLEQFGQSFYNPFIPKMVEELQAKGLIQEDDTKTKKGVKEDKKKGKGEEKKQEKKQEKKEEIKVQKEEEFQPLPGTANRKAKCIFIEKYPVPLIVVKSDGGYNYDTTDLAAIQYRLLSLQCQRAIYITDSGQRQHFEMVFAGAKKAGWLTTQRAEHMGFGCVLGQDGKKFKTRNGTTVKLLDLINQAKEKALAQLKSREKGHEQPEEKQGQKQIKQGEKQREQIFTALKPEQYEQAAEKLGIASIKYYDLKQNRISDYTFSFEKMLDPKGNTAVYLIYAYVRMCSIIRKSGYTSEQIVTLAQTTPFRITHPEERNLAAMLIKFYDVLADAIEELAINKVTDFIYEICVKVQQNYKRYRILGDENMITRIILCEAVRKVLEKAFFFVGIVPIEKI